MSKFVILLGGDLTATARLMRQIEGARVIAADSGIRHAEDLGVIPELWVGDFDSAGSKLQKRYSDIEKLPFPKDKDVTDGEIALDAASGLGARNIVVAGAFGGDRADHSFQILSMAMARQSQYDSIILTSGNEEAIPLAAGETFAADYAPGTLFSVLAFTDFTVTLEGAKWPLKDRHVPFGSSLTLSNEVLENPKLRVTSGTCLLYAKPS